MKYICDMEIDEILMEYLNENYKVDHNLLHDKHEDITLLPCDVEKHLMKVFSSNLDETHITLYMWLSINGMRDIMNNWYKLKSFDIGPIPDDIIQAFDLAWYHSNATIDLDYNYEIIDG